MNGVRLHKDNPICNKSKHNTWNQCHRISFEIFGSLLSVNIFEKMFHQECMYKIKQNINHNHRTNSLELKRSALGSQIAKIVHIERSIIQNAWFQENQNNRPTRALVGIVRWEAISNSAHMFSKFSYQI